MIYNIPMKRTATLIVREKRKTTNNDIGGDDEVHEMKMIIYFRSEMLV